MFPMKLMLSKFCEFGSLHAVVRVSFLLSKNRQQITYFEIVNFYSLKKDCMSSFNPSIVEGYAALFSCNAVVQASASITASM